MAMDSRALLEVIASQAAVMASQAAELTQLRALLARPQLPASPAPAKGKKEPKEPGAPRKVTNPSGPTSYNDMVWATRQELAVKAGVAPYETFVASAGGDEKKARAAFNKAAGKAGVIYHEMLDLAADRKAAKEGTVRKVKVPKGTPPPVTAAEVSALRAASAKLHDDVEEASGGAQGETAASSVADDTEAVFTRSGGGARPPREPMMGDMVAPEGYTLAEHEGVDYLVADDGEVFTIVDGDVGEHAGVYDLKEDTYDMTA